MTDDLKAEIKLIAAITTVKPNRHKNKLTLQFSFIGLTENADYKNLNFFDNRKRVDIQIEIDEIPLLIIDMKAAVKEWTNDQRQRIAYIENAFPKE